MIHARQIAMENTKNNMTGTVFEDQISLKLSESVVARRLQPLYKRKPRHRSQYVSSKRINYFSIEQLMIHVKQNLTAVNDLKLSNLQNNTMYYTNNKQIKTTIHVQRTFNNPYPSFWKHGKNVIFYIPLITHSDFFSF